MATAFLVEMQAELKALEAELELNPTFRKYRLLQTTYNQLRDAWASSEVQAPLDAAESQGTQKAEPTSRSKREGTKAASVADTAERWFIQENRRAQSSLLWEELQKQGVQINGSKPSAILAAVLSSDDRFDNARDARGIGYGLKSWSPEPAQPMGRVSTNSPEAVNLLRPSSEEDVDDALKPSQDGAQG